MEIPNIRHRKTHGYEKYRLQQKAVPLHGSSLLPENPVTHIRRWIAKLRVDAQVIVLIDISLNRIAYF